MHPWQMIWVSKVEQYMLGRGTDAGPRHKGGAAELLKLPLHLDMVYIISNSQVVGGLDSRGYYF